MRLPATVAHAAEATNALQYRGLDAPTYRNLGTSEDDAEETVDEEYEEGRDEMYDASIAARKQTYSVPLPAPQLREMSRAAMLIPYVGDIFRVMKSRENQPGGQEAASLADAQTQVLDAQTQVLIALDTLMSWRARGAVHSRHRTHGVNNEPAEDNNNNSSRHESR